MSEKNCQPRKRALYDWETAEAHMIFRGQLVYERVWIHECNPWPDRIDNIGRFIKRMQPRAKGVHNAITVGNHCLFPVKLPEQLIPLGESGDFYMGWLIHELTHAWQYQQMGWRYLVRALLAQARMRGTVYDVGDDEELQELRAKGWTFEQFNPEQQGTITQTFYQRKRADEDATAWEPYIQDLRGSGTRRI